MMKNKKYSEEFKREVLAQLATGTRSAAQLERELDITAGLLYKWRERYRVTESGVEPSEARAEAAEIRRLKRELEIALQERDILKKAIQVFSRREP
ncbi:MAG TPA: transposase [Candidatus Limnocylindrales bacterium]|nr:transposase [Candidatus Limnocylindrales bacterium]